MKARITILLLSLISCTKDTILLEQVAVEVNALVDYTSDCVDVYGLMVSESEALVFSGSYSMYSDDDFATMAVAEKSGNSLQCSGQTIYFDGLNAWLSSGSDSRRVSFDGRSDAFVYPYYSDFSFTPTRPGTYTTFPPLFGSHNTFLMAVDNINKMDVYLCDAELKTGNRIASTNTFVTQMMPRRMFKTNDLFILSASNVFSFPSVPHSVFTSTDMTTWQGPFAFDVLITTETILEITGNEENLVARSGDDQNNPGEYAFRVSTDAGVTWSDLGDGMNFIHAQAIDTQNIFAIAKSSTGDRGTISKLYKSANLGVTWTSEEALFYGDRIHFYDASNGLAMARGTLQITHDGGRTWKLIFTTPTGYP